MRARSGRVAIALAVILLWAGGCARNPPPATPAAPPAPAAAPAPKPDTIREQTPGAVDEGTHRLERDDLLELPPGTEQDLGGLYFDPKGADFSLWIDVFKKEVYRHWVVPQEAQFGSVRGHVDLEFTVERDGSMSALQMLTSSGIASLDDEARKALRAGKFAALPNDYKPPRVTMRVSFFYNEPPH